MKIYTDDKGNRYTIMKRPASKPGWHTFNRPAQWFTDLAEAEAALDEKAKKKGWWLV